MAGETEQATEFELALIEALSDAGCLERSLQAAAKEARNTGHKDEAAALLKAIDEFAVTAQERVLAIMDAAEISGAKHWAWANDPVGATARELALARSATRALQIHLERVNAFAKEEGAAVAAQAEAEAKAAEEAGKKEALERALAAARDAAKAKEAKEAAPAASPAAKEAPAPTKADAPAPAKAAAPAAKATPTKAAPAAKK